jgi:hypothetical protein
MSDSGGGGGGVSHRRKLLQLSNDTPRALLLQRFRTVRRVTIWNTNDCRLSQEQMQNLAVQPILPVQSMMMVIAVDRGLQQNNAKVCSTRDCQYEAWLSQKSGSTSIFNADDTSRFSGSDNLRLRRECFFNESNQSSVTEQLRCLDLISESLMIGVHHVMR